MNHGFMTIPMIDRPPHSGSRPTEGVGDHWREKVMRVLVIGATGGSGRAAVDALVTAGHEVTAFARHATDAFAGRDGVRPVDGDATVAAAVDAAVRGQDAVVVTLGIAENALRVRLRGSAGTPLDVRSRGTAAVVDAMQRHGVRRLVVQSSYGVGETRDRLPFSIARGLRARAPPADRRPRAAGADRPRQRAGLDDRATGHLTDGDEAAMQVPCGRHGGDEGVPPGRRRGPRRAGHRVGGRGQLRVGLRRGQPIGSRPRVGPCVR